MVDAFVCCNGVLDGVGAAPNSEMFQNDRR
jgi:hypothetical protein